MRVCGCVGMRMCGYAGIRVWGYQVMSVCGHVCMPSTCMCACGYLTRRQGGIVTVRAVPSGPRGERDPARAFCPPGSQPDGERGPVPSPRWKRPADSERDTARSPFIAFFLHPSGPITARTRDIDRGEPNGGG